MLRKIYWCMISAIRMYRIWSSIRLECRLIHPNAKMPFRKRISDAGYDLYAVEDVIINGHEFVNIPTGIEISPPVGWYYVIEGRSSMWKSGILTHHGVIDSSYTSEVFVGLYNLKGETYHVKCGDRIGQMIIHPQLHPSFDQVKEFSKQYSYRGSEGWGSSSR